MQINKHDIEEFRNLYYEEFNIYLLEDDAQEVATSIVELYTLLVEKLPSEHKNTTTLLSPVE